MNSMKDSSDLVLIALKPLKEGCVFMRVFRTSVFSNCCCFVSYEQCTKSSTIHQIYRFHTMFATNVSDKQFRHDASSSLQKRNYYYDSLFTDIPSPIY